MKKENMHKFLYAVCILLLIGFVIRLGVDYIKYDNINYSAPFYVFIIARLLEFILPGIMVFIVANIMKKKFSK